MTMSYKGFLLDTYESDKYISNFEDLILTNKVDKNNISILFGGKETEKIKYIQEYKEMFSDVFSGLIFSVSQETLSTLLERLEKGLSNKINKICIPKNIFIELNIEEEEKKKFKKYFPNSSIKIVYSEDGIEKIKDKISSFI